MGRRAWVMAAVCGGACGVAAGQAAGPVGDPAAVGEAVAPPAAAAQAPLERLPRRRPDSMAAPAADEEDGLSYPVSSLSVKFHPEQAELHEQLRAIVSEAEIGALRVELTPTPQGLIAPPTVDQGVWGVWPVRVYRLDEIGASGPTVVYESALRLIINSVRDFLRERSLVGFYVQTDPAELSPQLLTDRRPEGQTGLTLLVRGTKVTSVRGVSVQPQSRLLFRSTKESDLERIVADSPIRAWNDGGEGQGEGGAGPRADLLTEAPLQAYALRQNRRGFRRVDAALAQGSAEEPFTAELQYLVRDFDPVLLFFQASNTGTDETANTRYRFGADVRQPLGLGDRLTFDYTTSGFDEAESVQAFYEIPVFGNEGLIGRFGGGFSEFTASDVGLAGAEFTGQTFFFDWELSANVVQTGRLFIDAFTGLRFSEIGVRNTALGPEDAGEEQVLTQRAGLRVERVGEAVQFSGDVFFEWTYNELTGASETELGQLGRLGPDRDWVVLQWNTEASAYLEPLLNPGGYRDPSTWRTSTRAHEVYGSIRGQYAFNSRLIPNFQRVVGGLFTVRGYPESVVAGDSVVIFTGEYRFHLPRSFEPISSRAGRGLGGGRLFGQNLRPPRVFAEPDWDLVLKGFVDAADVAVSRPIDGVESGETLLGVGFGLELRAPLLFGPSMTFRADYGFALDEVDTGGGSSIETGDNFFHFLLTVLF